MLRAALASALLTSFATNGLAEKFPVGLDELQQADLIVVGTIHEIRIETEQSIYTNKPGNYHWAIYISLELDSVEKGSYSGSEIEFRCFRNKSFRSLLDRMTPSSHHPIPSEGTKVRAYLYQRSIYWVAALPNGITAPDEVDEASVRQSRLEDAPQVGALRSGYTYGLPLEGWVAIIGLTALVALIAAVVIMILNRRKIRRPTTAAE